MLSFSFFAFLTAIQLCHTVTIIPKVVYSIFSGFVYHKFYVRCLIHPAGRIITVD